MARAKKPPAKAKRKKKALRGEAAPNDPAGRIGSHGVLVLSQRQAGMHVTEYTALSLGAVWGCVRVIAEDLAKLPFGVFERMRNGGKAPRPEHQNEWLLQFQANPETSAFQWRETMVGHALTWGNGYSEIERDGAGRPHWLWQITPDRVSVERTERGKVVYDIANVGQPNTVLDAEDVFHLKGPGFDGLVGYSVIHLARRAIGLGMALEESAAKFSENDSTPGGVLEHPGKLKEPAASNLRESWARTHSGPHRRRTVAVLEEGLTWKQTGLPPEDSQMIQQRQATPAEICRWFRVPPHKIADLLRATFTNIEEQNIEYVGDALLPWARRLESEADMKLFGPINRGTLFTRLNFLGLLRGNTTARGAFYNSMLDRGVYSVNDVLEMEDMNPIGPDGDKRFVPLNMQLLEKAGEEPPAPKPPPFGKPGEPPGKPGEPVPEPGKNGKPDGKPPEPAKAMMPVLEDTFRRVLKRQEHRVEAALKRFAGDDAGLLKWRESFLAEHREYTRGVLAPVASSVAALLHGNGTATEIALGLVLKEYPCDPTPTAGVLAESLFNRLVAACGAMNA